jgi:hypothetical protein
MRSGSGGSHREHKRSDAKRPHRAARSTLCPRAWHRQARKIAEATPAAARIRPPAGARARRRPGPLAARSLECWHALPLPVAAPSTPPARIHLAG